MHKIKNSKIYLSLIALFLLFSLSLTGCSNNNPMESEPYTVAGQVVDMEGNGIEGLKVLSSNGHETITQEDGSWSLTKLKNEVNIYLAKDGLPKSITVKKENNNVDFIKCNVHDTNVNTQNIDDILTQLTSEDYNGRLAGSPGNNMTEEYISTYFENQQLEKISSLEDYSQEFNHQTLYPNSASELKVFDNNTLIKEYKQQEDFTLQPGWSNTTINGEANGPVFLYNNRNDVDQNGKIMLVSNESFNEVGGFEFGEEVQKANENGVIGVLIEKPITKNGYLSVYRNIRTPYDESGEAPIVFYISSSVYEEIKSNYSNNSNELYLKADYNLEDTTSSNIIGYIPGETDETLIISAHFDHLGKLNQDIYLPGALDNASGTTAMMELVRMINQIDQTPQKNIVFMGFNAEELGLIGSEHYKDNNLFPLDKTKLINLDMIGSAAKGEPLNLFTTETVGDIPLKNKLYNLLNIGYQIEVEKKLGTVSDDYHFEKALTLLHDDPKYSHTPLDTEDRVDIDKMKKVIKAVFTYILNEAYNTSAMDISKLAA